MQVTCDPGERAFSKERSTVAWRHGGLNLSTRCVDHLLQQEEEAAKMHSETAVLNPLLVVLGANRKGEAAATAAAAAANPADNMTAPASRKVHERLSSKVLYGLKGSVTGDQATAAVKAKQACESKRKAEEQVVQARTKQWSLDAHTVAIMMFDATVETLEGEALWTAMLLKNLGIKLLAALIVRKGAKPNPKGKKADLVLQFGVLWDTK